MQIHRRYHDRLAVRNRSAACELAQGYIGYFLVVTRNKPAVFKKFFLSFRRLERSSFSLSASLYSFSGGETYPWGGMSYYLERFDPKWDKREQKGKG